MIAAKFAMGLVESQPEHQRQPSDGEKTRAFLHDPERYHQFQSWFKAGLLLVLLLAVAEFIIRTWHWPLVGDAPLMHYVVFLIGRGMAPYRDIVDINMPGTYAIQGAVIHLFGGGALTWRIFDLILCGLMTAAMVILARPYGWFAGLFAGALFMLMHGRDGLIQLGQRDLFVTVLVLLGYVFLFHDLRPGKPNRRSLWAVMLLGFSIGTAATVKPAVILLGPALLVLACLARRRRNLPFRLALISGAICLALPWAIAFAYLFHEHAVPAFFTILLHLIPQHAHLRRRSSWYLWTHCVSSVLLPLFLVWVPIAYLRKVWRTWQGSALFIGVLVGFLSFYLQGKGYPYHRYLSESLLLLLIGIDLSAALKDHEMHWRLPIRLLAVVALIYGVFVVGIGSMRHAVRFDWRNDEFETMLQQDLTTLGGPRLDGQVQCLDMAAGCLNTLYRMKLEQSTGYLYDCYLFMPPDDSTVAALRRKFLDEISRHPPRVVVVTSHQCGLAPMDYRYSELHEWPPFDSFLARNYHLTESRIPPHLTDWIGRPTRPFGYRIYLRDGAQ